MTCHIEVINGVRAVVDGEPVKLRRQVQRLVAVLVAAGPTGIDGGALAEELWVSGPPPRWNAAIRNALTSLRAGVGPGLVQTEAGRYSLQSAPDDVDAWRILASAASPQPDALVLRGLGRFQPFDGLDLSPLLRESADALLDARVRLIERVTPETATDPNVVAGLVASVRADPFTQSTCVAVVDMLLRLGRGDEADQLLDEVEAAYTDHLHAAVPLAIQHARDRSTGSVAPAPIVPTSTTARSLPSVIADLTQRPMTARHQQLAADLAEDIIEKRQLSRLALLGTAGSGKSRFVAEVGNRLHQAGSHVIFATAVGDESSAYSPFLTASPAFRRRYLELDSRSEAAVWALWASILERWGAEQRPTTLIVDDAHRLDLASIRLLQFAHRIQPVIPITTILVGRTSTDEVDWPSFENQLSSDDRTAKIAVPPLDIHDIVDLTEQRWPHVSAIVRRDAALEIERASSGLPMVAHLLIDSLTGPTLRLPADGRSPGGDTATDRLRALDPDLQEALAAATLLGPAISADEIAELVGRDPDEVDDLLDLAIRLAVLVNTEEPGTHRFVHDLVRRAARGLVAKPVRAAWSRKLMATTEDPLRLARLALVARSQLSADELTQHLVTGAEAALERNLSRRCVQIASFALDNTTSADDEHRALCALAIAQMRLGALDEAASARTAMLDRTITAVQHERATRTMVDSIGFVEVNAPGAIRVADFDRLDPSHLDSELKVKRACSLARLAMWEGDRQRCAAELDLAKTLQETATQEGEVFHAEWRCEARTIDDGWFDHVASLRRHIGQHEIATRLLQLETIELAAKGRWREAETANAAFARAAEDLSLPDMQWQSKLMAAAFALAQGDLDESERLANVAFDFGMLFALPLAPTARAAQAFSLASHTGTLAEWLAFVEQVAPDLLRANLAAAAVGRARFEVGRTDEAWEIAEPTLEQALVGERRLAVSTVAILAPLIRRRASPALRQRCIDLVRTAGGSWIITGAGLGIQGPAHRVVAELEGDRRRLQMTRRQLADQPIWAADLDREILRLEQER